MDFGEKDGIVGRVTELVGSDFTHEVVAGVAVVPEWNQG
jgi:hypothetical protein